MFIVDEAGTLNRYFCDLGRRIPNAHLRTVCKVDEAGSACRYAAKIVKGDGQPVQWVCAKKTPAKDRLDEAVKLGIFTRNVGDNCDGFGMPEVSSEK